jgi:signal transduction histidine kinase
VSGATTLRPLGRSGADLAPIVLSPETAAVLRGSPGVVLAGAPPAQLAAVWPQPVGALVPLVAGDELVGLLACGTRRGDPLVAADFELLELLGRESAQRLRNLRLEARLRDRLVEIEAQAAELRRSRQRLVSVQDEERRRIERNLHDGVQQQLVSLAIRLQRAAVAAAAERPQAADLADLAVEAEQAVFALQELGRGIFPGVLTDQGLAAALRTQVARMPMAVHIDVQPDVVRHRLQPDVEAALYFVALEALTNAQKHAPGAAASVLLRCRAGRIVLEIVDDGCGFERNGHLGSGLENMADRMAAAGGTLEIESAPGEGTRVVASVPLVEPAALAPETRLLPHQPEADSLR